MVKREDEYWFSEMGGYTFRKLATPEAEIVMLNGGQDPCEKCGPRAPKETVLYALFETRLVSESPTQRSQSSVKQ